MILEVREAAVASLFSLNVSSGSVRSQVAYVQLREEAGDD